MNIHKTQLAPLAANDRRAWLRVGTLLDGLSTEPMRNVHVVYDRDQILYAGKDSPPRDLVSDGRKAPDLDLPGYALLPGLIDAHTHFFLEGGELDQGMRAAHVHQEPEKLIGLAAARVERVLRLGVIAARDAGDKDGVGLALSRLYRSPDRPVMPYVDSPGAAIHHRGRYGGFMGQPIEDYESLRDCVGARVKAGADRIKLIPTGIIDFKKGAVTSEPQMSRREVCDLVAAARSFDRQTFAHASGEAGIEPAIEGCVDSIEHGFFISTDQLAMMRDRQIAWVPTFSPLEKQVEHASRMGWDAKTIQNLRRVLDQHAESLVRAHKMGVQIIAGSDSGSYGVAHGLGLLDELELMERAGLSPLAVVNSATGASSRRLAFRENFGQIRSGYRGRLLLTRHSPIEGVANLRKDRFLLFDGAVFEADETFDGRGL